MMEKPTLFGDGALENCRAMQTSINIFFNDPNNDQEGTDDN